MLRKSDRSVHLGAFVMARDPIQALNKLGVEIA